MVQKTHPKKPRCIPISSKYYSCDTALLAHRHDRPYAHTCFRNSIIHVLLQRPQQQRLLSQAIIPFPGFYCKSDTNFVEKVLSPPAEEFRDKQGPIYKRFHLLPREVTSRTHWPWEEGKSELGKQVLDHTPKLPSLALFNLS